MLPWNGTKNGYYNRQIFCSTAFYSVYYLNVILWLEQVWTKDNSQVAGRHAVGTMMLVDTMKVKQQPGHGKVVGRVKPC